MAAELKRLVGQFRFGESVAGAGRAEVRSTPKAGDLARMATGLQRVVGQFKYDESTKGAAISEFRLSVGQEHDAHLAGRLNSQAAPPAARIQLAGGDLTRWKEKGEEICSKPFAPNGRRENRRDDSGSEGAIVRALIIDDSKAMRSILGRMLRGMEFEVDEAANGREAMERLQVLGKVDLALVDWNMPEMNGFEFVRAVRAEHNYDGVLLMMVTTETEMENVVRALAAGANEYVMKPFTQEVILEKLRLFGMAGS